MNDLKKNNIIVTGATGGIGNSIIKKLYEAGANILATGTKNEKLEELKKKFENIKVLKFDISKVVEPIPTVVLDAPTSTSISKLEPVSVVGPTPSLDTPTTGKLLYDGSGIIISGFT